ncbi:hypothetical protein NKI98_31405 [Mesorhizobium sp. M0222]|uniref:hypothetical protein n=1 Tax=Mesorhizobium sp. M0222 TaxID=2956921 RepID=UPI003334CF5F
MLEVWRDALRSEALSYKPQINVERHGARDAYDQCAADRRGLHGFPLVVIFCRALTSAGDANRGLLHSRIDGTTIAGEMFEDIDANLMTLIAVVSTVIVSVSVNVMGAIRLSQSRTAA